MRKATIERSVHDFLLIKDGRTVVELRQLLEDRHQSTSFSELGDVLSEINHRFHCNGDPSAPLTVVTFVS
jgi:hypothetical protein